MWRGLIQVLAGRDAAPAWWRPPWQRRAYLTLTVTTGSRARTAAASGSPSRAASATARKYSLLRPEDPGRAGPAGPGSGPARPRHKVSKRDHTHRGELVAYHLGKRAWRHVSASISAIRSMPNRNSGPDVSALP